MKNSAGIFFTDGKKVLVLKRSSDSDNPNTWSLPGGGRKGNETNIETAIRETKEEAGLKSIPGHCFDSLAEKADGKNFTAFLYKVENVFDVNLSKEHTDWKWVDLNDLLELNLHPKFKEQVPKYIEKIRKKSKTFSEWIALK